MNPFPPQAKLARAARRLPVVALCGSFAAILLQFQPDSLASLLEYKRSAVSQGEIWRLFTANWVHADWSHFVFDLLAFAATAAMAERLSRRHTIKCIVVASLAVTIVVHSLLPALSTYRGLSGVDSALYTFVVTTWTIRAHQTKDRTALATTGLLMSALIAKMTYEAMTGQATFVSQMTSGTVVVPLAHCTGALVGAICATWSCRKATNDGLFELTKTNASAVRQPHDQPIQKRAPVTGAY